MEAPGVALATVTSTSDVVNGPLAGAGGFVVNVGVATVGTGASVPLSTEPLELEEELEELDELDELEELELLDDVLEEVLELVDSLSPPHATALAAAINETKAATRRLVSIHRSRISYGSFKTAARTRSPRMAILQHSSGGQSSITSVGWGSNAGATMSPSSSSVENAISKASSRTSSSMCSG